MCNYTTSSFDKRMQKMDTIIYCIYQLSSFSNNHLSVESGLGDKPLIGIMIFHSGCFFPTTEIPPIPGENQGVPPPIPCNKCIQMYQSTSDPPTFFPPSTFVTQKNTQSPSPQKIFFPNIFWFHLCGWFFLGCKIKSRNHHLL